MTAPIEIEEFFYRLMKIKKLFLNSVYEAIWLSEKRLTAGRYFRPRAQAYFHC